MRDGVKLSAALHWPPGALQWRPHTGLSRTESGPGPATWSGPKYPVLIEYHPYRKDDRSAPRAFDHDYFAFHGFVSVRLDVRGSGSSEGVNTDEYMVIETRDGFDAVEWFASQPWCDGNVGMFGSSYGGFTCLQVASLQPPHLKAIAPIYSTDDRYTDDCHYKGGAFKAYYDTGTYGTMMVSLNALPPSPDAFPGTWQQVWKDRLDKNEPYMQLWLEHQTDDSYWRPGSLRPDYDRIKAATFIIGGWQDGYPNPLARMYENLGCARKLMVGPWNHSRPDVAVPGPRIHYLHEMRRWFDLHLKGVDDGVSKEPPVTFYVQSYDRPDQTRRDTTGAWRSDSAWPPTGSGRRTFYLKNGAQSEGSLMATAPAATTTAQVSNDPAAGLQGGLWSGGLPFGLSGDQRPDEALSLIYTAAALKQPVTVCGNAIVRLRASSSAPVAMFVAKLADVAPDGTSALVSRGVLNGTRRNGMVDPEAMTPGEEYDLEIELDCTAWRFEAGHRIRLAISGSDFPNSWPTPLPAVLSVSTGRIPSPLAGEGKGEGYVSSLTLPVITGGGLSAPEFKSPPQKPATTATAVPHVWQVLDDVFGQKVTVTVHRGGTTPVQPRGWSHSSDDLTLTLNKSDPSDVVAVGTHRSRLQGTKAGDIEAIARQKVRSDAEYFHWRVDLEVTRDGKPFSKKTWQKRFLRNLL